MRRSPCLRSNPPVRAMAEEQVLRLGKREMRMPFEERGSEGFKIMTNDEQENRK